MFQSVLAEGLPLAQELQPGLQRTGEMLARGLAKRAGERIAEDLATSNMNGSTPGFPFPQPNASMAAAVTSFVAARNNGDGRK